ELLQLHWAIGHEVVARQDQEGWGAAVIDRLGKDLQAAFPGMRGFSATNIARMRAFFLAYRADPNLPQAVGEMPAALPGEVLTLPWGHHVALVEQVKDPVERGWYAKEAQAHGWSRSVLEHQIESGLYRRKGAALTNFTATLPAPHSDLARELLKDPYSF